MENNLQIVLANRPVGEPEESNFAVRESPIPQPGADEVLVRNEWLSLDPYMRGRMSDAKSYAQPVAIGAVMVGGTAGVVVESRHPAFAPGDAVVGQLGWQRFGVAPGNALQKVDTTAIPLSAYLGPVGMPGVTAWVGLLDICKPKAGETVVVTAASGAVGGVVGQLAKLHGARAVGIAGGPAKCAYVREELGFDECLDYKDADFKSALKQTLSGGIDCLFENVGGQLFDTLLARMNPFSRIAVCGLIAEYNTLDPYGMKNIRSILVNRVRMQGFIVSDDMSLWPRALGELGSLVAQRRLKYRESVADGLAAAPAAFIGMLKGANFGKQLVRIG